MLLWRHLYALYNTVLCWRSLYWKKLELCKKHPPSAALGRESNCAGTGFLLFLPVLGSSGETGFSYSRGGVSCRECRCKGWLLGGYTTSRTSNGWAMDSPRPFGSVHSPIVTLGFAGTWEEDTAAGQQRRRNITTVPRTQRGACGI